ncbi:MAG: NAD(P)/FAD-dependent oxidoreductase [Phycisphaerales bacterium]|nr:NAD(P)/FAD-dependent oxidoreductase [Phycisphaerales bacterium]
MNSPTSRDAIIIIGAGVNGLRAAQTLRAAGREVVVIDRRSEVGGARTLRPDVPGPTLITGAPGGPGLVLHDDRDRMIEELRTQAPGDVDAWIQFRATLDTWTPWLRNVLTQEPPDVTASTPAGVLPLLKTGLGLRRLGRDTMMDLIRVMPMCIADWLNERFDDERLKAGLALPSLQHTWLGPWSPQTAANFIRRDVLRGLSMDAPEVDAACLHLGNGVRRILIGETGVRGVLLDDGTERAARAVISTADPVHTFRTLLAPRDVSPDVREAAKHYRTRGTAAVAQLTLHEPLRWRARPDEAIARARIVTTLDDLERAFDPIKYRAFGERLAVEIHQVSAMQATAIMSFVPYELDGGWTDDRREELTNRLTRTLSDHAENPESIADTVMFTPADIERSFGHTGGHLDHGELALDQMLIRPWRQCARYHTPIRGIFLGGGGVHPGGGENGIPGRLAAQALLRSR